MKLCTISCIEYYQLICSISPAPSPQGTCHGIGFKGGTTPRSVIAARQASGCWELLVPVGCCGWFLVVGCWLVFLVVLVVSSCSFDDLIPFQFISWLLMSNVVSDMWRHSTVGPTFLLLDQPQTSCRASGVVSSSQTSFGWGSSLSRLLS